MTNPKLLADLERVRGLVAESTRTDSKWATAAFAAYDMFNRPDFLALIEALREPVTYGLRRKGTTAIIGNIPPKIAAKPATEKRFLAEYEEIPLYALPTKERDDG